jgi:hypothetical protein
MAFGPEGLVGLPAPPTEEPPIAEPPVEPPIEEPPLVESGAPIVPGPFGFGLDGWPIVDPLDPEPMPESVPGAPP